MDGFGLAPYRAEGALIPSSDHAHYRRDEIDDFIDAFAATLPIGGLDGADGFRLYIRSALRSAGYEITLIGARGD